MTPYDNIIGQLKKAASIMNLEKDILTILSSPERVITATLALKMDNGNLKTFLAHRVQYSSICGPYKGGLRFHPQVDLEEIKALALGMTIKTALVKIPLGGGKGGLVVDTKSLSKKEIERLSRTWIKAFQDVLGPQKDIPAPDLYTNPQIMSYMVDEYSKLAGREIKGVITGKPLAYGGSKGRITATAQGAFYILEEALQDLGFQKELSVAIQGFGNAGGTIAKLLYDAGYKIVALADSQEALYNKKGFNIDKVLKYKKEKKSLKGFNNSQIIKAEELLTLNIDILIPAALDNQINKDNVEKIKAKVILELANGPTTLEAEEILSKKGIIIIPDVLANAGGVLVSYFEWLQNLKDNYWSATEVNNKLKEKIIASWQTVYNISKKYKTNLRTASFIGALEIIKTKFKFRS